MSPDDLPFNSMARSGISDLVTVLKLANQNTSALIKTIESGFASLADTEVGTVVSSTVLVGSAVSLTSGASKTITSVSLAPGEWDIFATIASSPAGTTTTSQIQAAIGDVDNTLPTPPNGGAYMSLTTALAAGVAFIGPVGYRALSLNTPTVYYLIANASFAVSTMSAYGYLAARRVK